MKIQIHHKCADAGSYRAERVKSLFNCEDGHSFSADFELPIEDQDWRAGHSGCQSFPRRLPSDVFPDPDGRSPGSHPRNLGAGHRRRPGTSPTRSRSLATAPARTIHGNRTGLRN